MNEWQEPSLEIQVFGLENSLSASSGYSESTGPGVGNQGTPWA